MSITLKDVINAEKKYYNDRVGSDFVYSIETEVDDKVLAYSEIYSGHRLLVSELVVFQREPFDLSYKLLVDAVGYQVEELGVWDEDVSVFKLIDYFKSVIDDVFFKGKVIEDGKTKQMYPF